MKYKIGDKAIIKTEVSHAFKYGEEVEIIELFPEQPDPHYRAKNDNGDTWYVNDNDLKKTKWILKLKMKKYLNQ